MKIKYHEKKLILNKKQVSNLNLEEMQILKGGSNISDGSECPNCKSEQGAAG